MRRVHGVSRADVAIAAAVTLGMEIEVFVDPLPPRGVAAALFALQGLMLAFRRVAPVPTLLMGLTSLVAMTTAGVSLHTPVTPLLFLVLAMYSVGLREPLARAAPALGVALALIFVAILIARSNGETYDITDIPFVILLSAAPWFVGRAMRARVQDSRQLELRAERLERERLQAVADERARIARDLHDVIAHSVSVMVVQAGAAEELLRRDPQRALDPVRAVQATGRQALTEMTRLLGLLREDSRELGLEPQPGLGQLEELVRQVREAGLPVELHVEGERRPLSPGLEVSAYRVVQEALTNVVKHAGEARARVSLRYGPALLELAVEDDGTGDGGGHSGGHGLAGMRERVSVFGGQLTAGPRPQGGFAVTARLPLEPAS